MADGPSMCAVKDSLAAPLGAANKNQEAGWIGFLSVEYQG